MITKIKLFEGKGVPNIVKTVVYEFIVPNINLKFGKNSFDFDLNNFFTGVKLTLIVEITLGKEIKYDGNINYLAILKEGFEKSIITLKIITDSININEISEALFHEITHLYELYKIKKYIHNSDWFYQSMVIDFKEENKNIDVFKYFLDILYLSFDHEIRAKTAQLHSYLITKNTSNKNELIELLKSSKSYRAYLNLKNFNYKKFIKYYMDSGEINQLIAFVNILNSKFSRKDIINNVASLETYFKKWNFHFNDSAKKYYKKMLNVIDEVVIDKNKKIEENHCYLFDVETPLYFEKKDLEYIENRIKTLIEN